MNHQTTPRFWECYKRLPSEIQELADENYELLKENPEHSSLRLKPIGKVWSVRVSLSYRALGIREAKAT
jgi:hypothetical protein